MTTARARAWTRTLCTAFVALYSFAPLPAMVGVYRLAPMVVLAMVVMQGEGAAGPAAQPVNTIPYMSTTAGTDVNGFASNASGTIVSTNAFQQLWGANTARSGCTVQNNGTHTMYVTEGLTVAGSTTGLAVQLASGATYMCAVSGVVLRGQINITGTAGDAFYAAQY